MTLEEVKAIPIREVAEKCNVSVGRKGFCGHVSVNTEVDGLLGLINFLSYAEDSVLSA